MDKKSFIRGFGVGVLFATLILGISCFIRTSDSAVIQRAKKLGMVYDLPEESLFDKKTKGSSMAAVTAESDSQKTQKKKLKATATPQPTKQVVSHKEREPKEDTLEQEKKQMEKEFEEESREFTIRAGDWSNEVSRRLEEMDLISDAKEFDAYLEKNGYSDTIKAGTFKIPVDASYEEIARAITTK